MFRLLLAGIFVATLSSSSLACSISDIGCLDLRMPTIELDLQLENPPVLRPTPQQPVLKRETNLEWCLAYYENRRGKRTIKNDRFCRKILTAR